jgi:hypothetical protein
VACPCVDADHFYHPRTETFCLVSFLARKKKKLASIASIFFLSLQESLPNKKFCPRVVKNYEHQHKGKPLTRGKSQDAVTSM